MKRYIECEKAVVVISEWLMKALHSENMSSYNEGERAAYRTALSEIVNLPAADVRPVVYCKDCKCYQQSSFVDNHMECARSGFPVHSVDFCSRGEKREES